MRIKHFKDYKALSDLMMERMYDGCYVVAVLFYDAATALFKELAKHDELSIGGVRIEPVDYDGYADEYYVSIAPDNMLDAEQAKLGDCYLRAEADLYFVDNQVNSSILPYIDEKHAYEIYVGEAGIKEDVLNKLKDLFDGVDDKKNSNGDTSNFSVDTLYKLYDLLSR